MEDVEPRPADARGRAGTQARRPGRRQVEVLGRLEPAGPGMKGPDMSSQAQPLSPRGRTPSQVGQRVVAPPGVAREESKPAVEIAALLSLAGLDAELLEREARVQKLVRRMEEQRYAVAGLRAELESDRGRLTRPRGRSLGADLSTLRKHILENEKAYAQLSRDAEQSEGETRALSAELEQRSAEVAEQRAVLRSRLSAEILEIYATALRSGREPAIVRLVQSVCTGCNMRLHSKLEHQIRRRWGIAACPHCQRLVYDESGWRGVGRRQEGLPEGGEGSSTQP